MQNKEFLKKIWNNIQIKMQNFIENEIFYEDFFLKTNFLKIEENIVTLETKTNFSKKIIEDNYLKIIENLFLESANENLIIKIISKENKNEKIIEKNNNSNLNYKLNFNNFIVGSFNKKIYKAAKIICENEKPIYNPFFIYGDTGLGKTHIINSIGIELEKKFNFNVLFMNTEDFIRKVYHYLSIAGSELETFKESFEKIDVLIIDDIQFLSNKDKINEIFFYIFNFFIKNEKIIIISSDRIPNELKIDNRMISRFNSGLTIKIPKPDIETIYQIIKYKIKENINNIKFTENSIKFIANRFNSDIRSLEGVINKILFQISIKESKNFIINEEKIKELLDIEIENGLLGSGYKISPNTIIENVSTSYGISKDLVVSKSRVKEASFARKICIYILREKMKLSYSEIGTYLSNRDHSTILESYKKIKEEIINNNDLKKFIENLIKNI